MAFSLVVEFLNMRIRTRPTLPEDSSATAHLSA
jgi:hypothetical protein